MSRRGSTREAELNAKLEGILRTLKRDLAFVEDEKRNVHERLGYGAASIKWMIGHLEVLIQQVKS